MEKRKSENIHHKNQQQTKKKQHNNQAGDDTPFDIPVLERNI